MTSHVLAEARSRASQLPNGELRHACEKVIDEVESRVSSRRIGNWTFRDVAKWLNREPTDQLVQACLSILADTQGSPILEMHFLFFDPADDDASGDVIEDDYVIDAFRTGYLVSPLTGQPIDHFEQFIAPFFCPTQRLTEELAQGASPSGGARPSY